MAGTVTGKNASLRFAIHSGGATAANIWSTSYTHSTWGIGDFSLTFDKGVNESNLIGERGNYSKAGSLTIDGSLTAVKFGASGNRIFLDNLVPPLGDANYDYLAISGAVSTDTDATYLRWCLHSCQVTGYDVSLGDANTITEASIDFTVMNPDSISYSDPVIKG